jgi:hypothetical protein
MTGIEKWFKPTLEIFQIDLAHRDKYQEIKKDEKKLPLDHPLPAGGNATFLLKT